MPIYDRSSKDIKRRKLYLLRRLPEKGAEECIFMFTLLTFILMLFFFLFPEILTIFFLFILSNPLYGMNPLGFLQLEP